MIVIDSSALIAILDGETEREAFLEIIFATDQRLVNAVTFQETMQVAIGRRGNGGRQDVDELLDELDAEIVSHDKALARLALDAFQKYGKGIHPKARLNLGDCAAYALSKRTGAPLLFKGGDFAATDIVAALLSAP